MSFYVQPRYEPTPEEKLLAAVVGLNHRIPVGFQIGMPMHLDRSLAALEELFTAHKLPLRKELLAELTRWHKHAEEGLPFAHQCDQLMTVVVQTVDATVRRA